MSQPGEVSHDERPRRPRWLALRVVGESRRDEDVKRLEVRNSKPQLRDLHSLLVGLALVEFDFERCERRLAEYRYSLLKRGDLLKKLLLLLF
jgi:hypothetical protein